MTQLVFLIDVDNTLLNNDAIKQDFDDHLRTNLGAALANRFWEVYEQVREEKSVIDIPASLVKFREQVSYEEMSEAIYMHVMTIFDHYPFQQALYPQALQTLEYLGTLGQTVIVSDGDQFFQVKKIVTSHLSSAVEGRVLLYKHKQEHLDEIMKLYPGEHYVIIDDKPQILLDSKTALGTKATTVFVNQGKYAAQQPEGFSTDIAVKKLADLQEYTREQFLKARG